MTIHGSRPLMAGALVLSMAVSASAQQHVEGQAGPGSLYALDLPEAWNGDLVVYAHGIVDPVLDVSLPSAQDHFAVIRDSLLARGFAVASSSFSENGFALKDAIQRTHQLSKCSPRSSNCSRECRSLHSQSDSPQEDHHDDHCSRSAPARGVPGGYTGPGAE